ncbi:MAG: peptidase dimerization domain-containing protein [Nitrospira sp.]|nr:peptidase dimerization domain-containing protein [Nitrospira sp.]
MGLVSSSVAHLDRHYHPGTIVVSEGPVNASSDNFAVEIIGQGAHGARPHESIDAVVVGSLMIMALQTIVSREVDPARPSVVSVGQFHAGTAPNVVAGQAKLEGTVRAQDPAVRQQLLNSVRRIAESIGQLHGAKISVTVIEGTPPLTPDFIVDEDSASYPSGGDYRLEQMQAEGYPALLRIERGRVKNRGIFGPMRLDYGFFKRQARRTNYFLARSGTQVVGAVGYTMDQVEHTVRVFELIALADDVVRFLLVEL